MTRTYRNLSELRAESEIPVVIVDDQGIVSFVNPLFESVFGWSHKEIVGQSLLIIIPKVFHDAHNMGFSRFLNTGQATLLQQPLELKAIDKSGNEFPAEHYIVAEQQQGKWIIGATIQPMMK